MTCPPKLWSLKVIRCIKLIMLRFVPGEHLCKYKSRMYIEHTVLGKTRSSLKHHYLSTQRSSLSPDRNWFYCSLAEAREIDCPPAALYWGERLLPSTINHCLQWYPPEVRNQLVKGWNIKHIISCAHVHSTVVHPICSVRHATVVLLFELYTFHTRWCLLSPPLS